MQDMLDAYRGLRAGLGVPDEIAGLLLFVAGYWLARAGKWSLAGLWRRLRARKTPPGDVAQAILRVLDGEDVEARPQCVWTPHCHIMLEDGDTFWRPDPRCDQGWERVKGLSKRDRRVLKARACQVKARKEAEQAERDRQKILASLAGPQKPAAPSGLLYRGDIVRQHSLNDIPLKQIITG